MATSADVRFSSGHVRIAPGSLYCADLNSAEPTAVTGAWPSAWNLLGYTDQGSEWDYTASTSDVGVEEEVLPIATSIDNYTGKLTFALAETVADNLIMVLNAGVPGNPVSGVTGATTDQLPGKWVEPPVPGTERYIMLGWDSLPKGVDGTGAGQVGFARLIIRRAFNTGGVKRSA